MTAKYTLKTTGEVIELEVKDLKSLVIAYSIAQDHEKAGKALKEKLRKEISKYLDENGKSEEVDGKQFKSIRVQKMAYNKAVLREIFDEDTYDLFMKPSKTAIDSYIAENLENLGEYSTKLRKSMVPEGEPYMQVKLEKLTRE